MRSLPEGTTIGRVDLAVGDRQAVVAFYTDVVGLDLLDATDQRSDLGVDATTLIRLHDAPQLAPRTPTEAGLFHLAVRTPSRSALGHTYRRLRQSGRLTGASDHLVSEALYANDPEDNGVEVYRDRDRSRWERTDDGGIRLVTWPLDVDDLVAVAEGDTTASTSLPSGTDIGHVHLEVTDLERAKAFYVETLGFDIRARYPGALFVAAGGYHHHVGLNVWNDRHEPTGGRGLHRFDIQLPVDADLDAIADRVGSVDLREAGIVDAPSSDRLLIRDPDGIELRFLIEPHE